MQQDSGGALPQHIGIIMDGNGRWAKARGLPRNAGHRQGADNFGRIVRHAKTRGVPCLTVYAFSTENWKRSPEEVRGIMSLLRGYLKDADKYRKEGVRTLVAGDPAPLDDDLKQMIRRVEEGSAHNTGITVNIALNYGGRDEILRAARALAARCAAGELEPTRIDEALFSQGMYTAGQPEVDLIVRTGGEQRISNFLLWQSAYAEFVFSEVLWPDWGPDEFDQALREYARRERRMGGVSD